MNKLCKLSLRQIILIAILNTSLATHAQQTEARCGNNLTQELIKLGENSDDPELKRKSLELKQSCEEEQKARRKAAESQENLEIWQEVKRVMSKLPNKDMYHEVHKRSVKELKLHPHEISRMMEKNDPRIRAIFDKMTKEDIQRYYNQIKAKRALERKKAESNKEK